MSGRTPAIGENRRPTDRTEWALTAPSVNSYYSLDRNSVNFPAGILQPPFYQAGRDAALNYGARAGSSDTS